MREGDLFDDLNSEEPKDEGGPLAFRMRPRTLDEFIGQEKVLGPGKPLRQWIERDRVPSIILWGPPGCGKTTLSQIIAKQTRSEFMSLSAVLAGVKDIKEVVERARNLKRIQGAKTLLFVDEIHRFNKAQQDALLPHVEDGTITLVGATTENPSFELNSALLSRAPVVRLERLNIEALERVIQNALEDKHRGLGGEIELSPEATHWLAESSEGDARRALTSLEALALYHSAGSKKVYSVQDIQEALSESLGRRALMYDKSGEEHYNVISAFIKSLRDSDPHAGLYYLARMLEAGEDPLFIARRLTILASEDVGNADPRAIMVAIAAKEAVDFIGMPEARITLAQAVTYMALAPKSNAAYMGIGEAIAEVHKTGALPTPLHLRNAPTKLMKTEGYGSGYRYAHDAGDQRAKQTHLPAVLVGKRFYHPKDIGNEKVFKEKLDRMNPDFE